MTTILAVDPGSEHSGWVVFDGRQPLDFGKSENEAVRLMLVTGQTPNIDRLDAQVLVLEMMAPRGMPFSSESMETLVWLGRFIEAWNGPFARVFRRDVKLAMCGVTSAKDAHVRQAVLDRFGGKKAIGTKKAQGPLYGMKADIWQALALAVTWFETNGERKNARDAV